MLTPWRDTDNLIDTAQCEPLAADPFTVFDSLHGAPITIVFGTFNYRSWVLKWIEAAERGACDHWRILCMDVELRNLLSERGYGAQTVDFYDLFPDAPKHDFESLDRKGCMRALMPLRVRLFRQLAMAGRDFIHSDADALWIHDPRPWLAHHGEFDLIASQGCGLPWQVFLRRRFTLCAGFFLCRANGRTADYFKKVHVYPSWDDQVSMNMVLDCDAEGEWAINGLEIVVKNFRHIWKPPSMGVRFVVTTMRALRWIWLAKWLSMRRPLKYMYTSREVIRGQFSNGLTVAVIPWQLIARRNPVSVETLVQHGYPLEVRSLVAKAYLKFARLWR